MCVSGPRRIRAATAEPNPVCPRQQGAVLFFALFLASLSPKCGGGVIAPRRSTSLPGGAVVGESPYPGRPFGRPPSSPT